MNTKQLDGNAIVGQSGGPTAAINATLSGVIREAARSGCIHKIYGALHGIEGILEHKYCSLNELSIDTENLQLLECTPASALGSCRKKLPDLTIDPDTTVYDKILDFFKELNIRYFFYIGGNDSMDTVAKFSSYLKTQDYEMRVIGVPKTIDNDLVITDHTPGFGSAAKYIATITEEMLRDASVYTVRAVTIIEIMGRDSGWLTAAAALPGMFTDVSPDLVYLPEIPFSFEGFYNDVEAAFAKHPNVVVAVSEGLTTADGKYVCESLQDGKEDAFGHKMLSGTGKALELALKEKFGCKVRSVEVNLPQRCASHILSRTDIAESVEVGRESVLLAIHGMSGIMPVFVRESSDPYVVSIKPVDVHEIANKIKKVPREYINERGNGVTRACIEYIAPLIAGETYPRYRGGMPVHYVIKHD